MRRRDFITLLGGAAASPLAARAQQPRTIVGFLHSASPDPNVNFVAAFRKGLSETGYVDGQNVAIEFRWAEGREDRLAELAADLIRRGAAVIATPASTPAALAAKAATSTIPIVFTTGGDPVALGLVTSLNRPGGNVTGITFMTVELTAKRLGLLHDLVPSASPFAALVNPNSPFLESIRKDLQSAALNLGLQVETLYSGTNREIDATLTKFAQEHSGAPLAARYAMPAIFPIREFTDIGGLMSYGPNFADAYRQAGVYTGRILKGEKPADLPVTQPTTFEFVINLQTARLLRITVAPTLLALADEVIE
jgi:ABC-type uncharacterized transport system substrate-binding protein